MDFSLRTNAPAKAKPRGLPPRASRGIWRKRLAVWVAGAVALVLVFGADELSGGTLDRLHNILFDTYQRLVPRPEAGAPLAVVDIDEASIGQLGQWPWPRTTIARMVDRITAAGAATIAFDIVFPEPDRTSPSRTVGDLEARGVKIDVPPGTNLDNDGVLAQSFSRSNVVAGIAISDETAAPLPPPKAGFAIGGDDPKTYLPAFRGGVSNLPVLTAAAAGIGFFSFPPSSDGVIRSLPLVALAQGNLYPALSVEALRLAQGAGSFIVRSTGASGEADTGAPAMAALKDGNFAMPTGAEGEFSIYFSGLPDMPTISAADLLAAGNDARLHDELNGRIVLIGTSAVGLRDLVQTPISQAMPGVRVHAEVIDQIMGQTFLSRPDWMRGAEIAGALLCGLIIMALEGWTGAVASTVGMVALVGIAGGFSWWAFNTQRLLVDPILPDAAALAVFALATPVALLWTDREKRFINLAFGRYLSPELVGRLADNPQALKLGGELRELTVLFSDIRGFTSLSENLDPVELTALLNNFLTPATGVLLAAEATIDKYIGDAIMAFWNAPLDIADHRRKACIAALRVTEALAELNQSSGQAMKIGIGLNSGPCCVGNLGSAQRFSYSAIGDAVNVASRVEGLTKQCGVSILATEATRDGAADLAFLEADLVRVVGRKAPLPIYALIGDEGYTRTAAFQALAAAHAAFVASYRRADVDAAAAQLTTLRATASHSLAGLYEVYADRLAEMRETPPEPGWDGVFTAQWK